MSCAKKQRMSSVNVDPLRLQGKLNSASAWLNGEVTEAGGFGGLMDWVMWAAWLLESCRF